MSQPTDFVVVIQLPAGSPEELIAGLTCVMAQLGADVERLKEAAATQARLRARYQAATNPCLN